MKKYITYLLATALVGSAFVSCTERLQEGEMRISTHKVHFAASDMETRTGLSIDGTTVTPDWNKTALESIHLFEIDANEAVAYGETIAITTSEDNATAHFEADFPTDMSIIVDPSDPEEDSGAKGASNGDTKGTRVSPYRYAAIIAQKPDKNNLTFVVPSEQHPDAETLKDPDADFLIGYSRKAYDTEHFFDEPVVDLYFDRVAALGRLAISNFAEGEKVQSVTINAQNGLTGSASYADIDFENGSVSFVREEGPGAITLVYDGGMDIPADGPFYAYFVAIPGSATLTSVEVVTNQYHYTKTIEGGKELTFSEKAFKSMNLDLSTATREEVAPSGLTWYKASVLEDGIDYIIVSNGYALKNNGSKAVVAAQTVEIVDGTISLEETDGLIWTANANSEFTEYGTHTLSNGSEHLWRHSDNGTFTLEANNEAITKYMVWNYDGEYLWNISIYTGSGSAQISDYYAYYSSGWKISTTKTAATLFTSRAPQELAFTPAASAEYDLATSEWIVAVPTLSGVQTSVTYALSEDSNPAVATVDADGTVHPLSKGAVTIVATAAGNDQYQAASASYTLRVVDSSVTTNTYIKVTSTSDLEVGAKYLLVFEGLAGDTDGDGNPKVFKPILDGNTFSKATSNALDVEIESGTISSSEFEGSHLTLESGYYLKVDAVNRYLYPTGSSSGGGTLSAEATATNKLTIAFDNGIAQIKVNSGSNYLVWSTSSHYFSSNAQVSGDYSTGICLYKLDDGRQAQTLSFSPTEVNFDMAGSVAFTAPTLSGAQTDVTYSSSNSAVATVNATSGAVTIVGTGTTIITANAKGTNAFKPATATYTIHVIDGSATPKTYVRVTSASNLVIGAKYLLVYESTPSVFKPILNGSTFKKTADNVLSVTISNHSITSAELADCELTLAEGYYLYVASADRYVYPLFDGSQTTTLEAESSPSHNLTVTINSDGTAKITNAASTASSFTWSTRSSYFSSTTSATATINVCLYKEDDGSNPGGGDDPTPTVKTTYYIASSIEAGKSYVIVSGGQALKNDNGSAAAVGVTVNSESIEVEGDVSTLLWSASTDPDKASAFRFTNNDQTLRRSSGSVTIGTPSSSAYNNQWTYNSSSKHVMLERSATQTYYLYYNSGWKVDGTVGEALLYTAEPGSNPGGGDDPGDDPGEEKYYVLVTSEPASWDGTYLIVNTASDGSGSAMNGTSTASVTISEGKIRSTSTIDGYALTVTSAGEVHPNQTDSNQGLIAYDIKFNDGNWLYWYSSKYKQTSEDQSSRHNKCTLYYDNGGVRIMSAGYNVNLNGEQLSSTPSKNYLYYSSSSFTMSSSHSSDRVQLYKLENP